MRRARDLRAIIVSERFATRMLGRAPRRRRRRASVSAPRFTPEEREQIEDQIRAAEQATGVRFWMPVMLIHPDIAQILNHYGFVASRVLP